MLDEDSRSSPCSLDVEAGQAEEIAIYEVNIRSGY